MPNTQIHNVNVELLIATYCRMEETFYSDMSWDAKHHKIFYEDMSVRKLYEADAHFMDLYTPLIGTAKSECSHLIGYCVRKVTYLKNIGDKS
jgi:superoxide dismutase